MEAKGRLWEAYGSMIVALRHKMMALVSPWGQVSVHHGYAKRFFIKVLKSFEFYTENWSHLGHTSVLMASSWTLLASFFR